MSDYIPPEVLVEILLRLPSKSLIRFSCVCKLWYSLIFSSKFISMYTHFNSTINRHKNAQFIIRHYSRTHGKEIFSHHFDHDLSFSNYEQLDCPLRSNRGYLVDIVGSCNGLICLSDSDSSVDLRSTVLWNPSLGKFKVLPVRSSLDRIKYDIVLGFGFDFKTIDYKVVAILSLGKLRGVDIFALSENSWRSTRAKVSLPSFYITKSPQVFVNGNIHWIGYYEGTTGRQNKSIVAIFDVVNEVFGELGMPNELANENMYDPDCIFSIVKFGKSLSLIRYDEKDGPSFNRCCIWVMKEYGVVESWIKQYTIFPYSNFWKTLDLRRNGQILLATSYGELVSFDVKSKRVNRLKLYGEARSFYVDTYVESLVLSRASNNILGQASSSYASSHNKARKLFQENV